MPREQISDHTTDTRKVEVTWRRDENEPGYVQLATLDTASVTFDLIGAAIGIISNADAPATGWPGQAEEWRQAARDWLDRAAQADVDGTFAHLGPDECQHLIKTLHKAKRQAFGGGPQVEIHEGSVGQHFAELIVGEARRARRRTGG